MIKRFSLLLLVFLMPVHCCAGEAEYASLDPPVFLPNGNEFKTWSDRTVYTKTYYVDQRHPGASDENPGSRDKPFLTINKAAQVVGPGERVVVESGVYRELIEPRLGGEGPEKMISYEAAPGATVIVKGSGIYQHDCDYLTVAHNFVANCTGKGIEMRICQGRMVNGRLSTCTKNIVLNNILINAKEGIWFIDDDNISNRNIFVNCGPPFDFAAWQKKGFGKDSLIANINATFDQESLKLTWSTDEQIPLFERLKICSEDFHDRPWPTEKVPAGPFQYPAKTPTTIDLREF